MAPRRGSKVARYSSTLLLWTIGLYLILNYSFVQVRIPPVAGNGIPIGEAILLSTLAFINYRKVLPRLSRAAFIAPFLLWWGLGLGRVLIDVPVYGVWAFRDASQVIESLYLLLGFIFAASPQRQEQFFQWLPAVLVAACIYALTFPFAEMLQLLSPKVTAAAGHQVPLLFTYVNSPQMMIWAACYILLMKNSRSQDSKVALLTACGLLGFTVFFLQSRTVYLQILVLLVFYLWCRKDVAVNGILGIGLVVVCLAVVELAGLKIETRFGRNISLDFLLDHLFTITGGESEGLVGAAAGVGQRVGWWADLYDRLTSHVGTLLFGLGYGFPLIDFGIEHGVAVREPHNSYISVVARLGVIGFTAWGWMHAVLLRSWCRAYRACRRLNLSQGQNRLLTLMTYFIICWIYAIGEDAFEKPYVSIPYYFFWGVVLRFSNDRSRECLSLGRV
jgi:hypothetical protein